MPVIGMNFKSIEAKINKVVKGRIDVNSTPVIKNIEERELNIIGKALGIEFEFKTVYNPDVGSIQLTGEILYQTDKAKDILKEWKKNKKLSSEIVVPILNIIFRKCLAKTLTISEDLQLPPPIRFPVVKPKE